MIPLAMIPKMGPTMAEQTAPTMATVSQDGWRSSSRPDKCRPCQIAWPRGVHVTADDVLRLGRFAGRQLARAVTVLLLNQGKIYNATFEITWVRKLLPGHPGPRLNVAVALERGGKIDEAIAAAQAALEVRPGYLPAVHALLLALRKKSRISAWVLFGSPDGTSVQQFSGHYDIIR
jgi:hypothetical protein